MVNLDNLRALVTLHSRGTVTATAEQLGYTPSAISQQLTKLQAELKTELLRNVGGKLTFTPSGIRIHAAATEILARWESAVSDLEASNGRTAGLVRLSAFPSYARGKLPAILERLADRYPHIDLSVTEARSHRTLELLQNGEVDLAISHDWTDIPFHEPPGIHTSPVGSDTADVVVAKSHPLAKLAFATVDDLSSATWTIEPGSVSYDYVQHALAAKGHTLNVRYYIREFDSQIELIRRNLAIGLIPRLGRARLPEDVQVLSSQLSAIRRHYVSVRSAARNRPAISAVVSELEKGAQDGNYS